MAVPFSNTKLRVPKGFQNILEGLTREILRTQPENPFEFGAKYFEQLLRVREETGHDPALHGARLEDRYYNNDSFKSPSVDPGSPMQQDAALTIQTNYRKHTAEKEVANLREDEAAEKIQAGFRGYQDRQKFTEMKEPSKDDDEVDIDLNDPEVEKAAVQIQAGFKGFKARQEIKEIKGKAPAKAPSPTPTPPPAKGIDNDIDIDLTDPEVNAAALKIQSGFRGHKSRQQVKEMKEARNSATTDRSNKDDIDIDLDDPETEKAALKIQAGFKGYQTRKEIKSKRETQEATMADVKKPEPDGKNDDIDIDLNDPEVVEAATKIQAGFKGFKTRQELKAKAAASKDEESQGKGNEGDVEAENEAKNEAQNEGEMPDEGEKPEEVDIDLNDPEVQMAATKIQAGFKGFKTRKELREKKSQAKTDDD